MAKKIFGAALIGLLLSFPDTTHVFMNDDGDKWTNHETEETPNRVAREEILGENEEPSENGGSSEQPENKKGKK